MNERVKHIFSQAQQLLPEERAELMDMLLAATPAPDADWEKAWAEEAERRWQAYKRGEMQSYSWDEVKARLREA
jgi:putative addiction module component (TIGR02574 family)